MSFYVNFIYLMLPSFSKSNSVHLLTKNQKNEGIQRKQVRIKEKKSGLNRNSPGLNSQQKYLQNERKIRFSNKIFQCLIKEKRGKSQVLKPKKSILSIPSLMKENGEQQEYLKAKEKILSQSHGPKAICTNCLKQREVNSKLNSIIDTHNQIFYRQTAKIEQLQALVEKLYSGKNQKKMSIGLQTMNKQFTEKEIQTEKKQLMETQVQKTRKQFKQSQIQTLNKQLKEIKIQTDQKVTKSTGIQPFVFSQYIFKCSINHEHDQEEEKLFPRALSSEEFLQFIRDKRMQALIRRQ